MPGHRCLVALFLYSPLLFGCPSEADPQPAATAIIPDFVNKYAPLVYLDQNELYLPSDIQAQLNHTIPEFNYAAVTNAPSPLLLMNLDHLNDFGNGTCTNFRSCSIYLTSKDDVATNPPWIYGVLPDPVTGETVGAKSAAIIVTDHGNDLIDAFYMYFYAFNLGPAAAGQVLGDHVGDWEHTMVRFANGTPMSIWLSQHDSGQAFTYDAISKNGSRPIVYSAIGSHANFAVPGTHTRTVAMLQINDYTSLGPLWDSALSAYYYAYNSSSSSFNPSLVSSPTAWLSYFGHWGDKRYPDSDPRQVNFLHANISWKYEDGPTGPLDKNLDRPGTCPDPNGVCTTISALPTVSGSSVPVTVTHTSFAPGGSATITGQTGTGAATATTTSASASASTSSSSAVSLRGDSVNLATAAISLFLAFI